MSIRTADFFKEKTQDKFSSSVCYVSSETQARDGACPIAGLARRRLTATSGHPGGHPVGHSQQSSASNLEGMVGACPHFSQDLPLPCAYACNMNSFACVCTEHTYINIMDADT